MSVSVVLFPLLFIFISWSLSSFPWRISLGIILSLKLNWAENTLKLSVHSDEYDDNDDVDEYDLTALENKDDADDGNAGNDGGYGDGGGGGGGDEN